MRERSPEASQAPLDIAPGTTWLLTPGPDLGDHGQAAITQAVGPITRINLQLTEFYFVDESVWRAGMYMIPEPAPERYRLVTPAEFNASQGQH